MQECRHLEEKLSCQGCTDSLLNSQSSLREKKREILQTDWDSCITEASDHCSTAIAAQIAVNVSWMRLWDMALDYGPRGTECLQALYRDRNFGKVSVTSVILNSKVPTSIISL